MYTTSLSEYFLASRIQCPDMGFSNSGDNLEEPKKSVESWKKCAKKCVERSLCEMFVYEESTETCALKKESGKRKEKDGLVSGTRSCALSLQPSTGKEK